MRLLIFTTLILFGCKNDTIESENKIVMINKYTTTDILNDLDDAGKQEYKNF